jgi:hypothetical protein
VGVQVNSPMPVVLETPSKLVLRHNQKAALVWGLGCLAAAVAVVMFLPSGPKLFIAGALGLFAAIVLVFAFYRDELLLDLGGRQYRRSNGFVGRVAETRGELDEIPEVALTLERRGSSEDSSPTWQVSIRSPRWTSSVVLEAHTKEEAGYAALEKWAKKLRRDAVDRTGQTEARKAWDALDASVRGVEQRGRPAASDFAEKALADAFGSTRARPSSHPPEGSSILVTRASGRQRVVLPPLGWNTGATIVSLFGAAFGGFGALAALVGAHVITGVRVNGAMPDGPVWGLVAVGGFFALIGFGLILAMVFGSRAREYVEDAPDALVVGTTWAGITKGGRLPKRAIESVDLSVSPSPVNTRSRWGGAPAGPLDVRIRTDARIVRLGRYLSEDEQRWLRDTLEQMARA